MADLFDRLIRRMAYLERMVDRLSMQQNNMLREAKVLDVDPDTGTAVVDAHGGKSKKIPWLQRAGSIRDWDPPSVGERVLMLSPNGDPGRGLILPGGYSQQYGAPHNQLAETRRQIGSATDTMSANTRVIESQLIILRGTVQIEGQMVTHNGVNIGDTHVHGGVVGGGDDTATPH